MRAVTNSACPISRLVSTSVANSRARVSRLVYVCAFQFDVGQLCNLLAVPPLRLGVSRPSRSVVANLRTPFSAARAGVATVEHSATVADGPLMPHSRRCGRWAIEIRHDTLAAPDLVAFSGP